MIILSLKEYNALLNEAFMRGREHGRAEGQQEFITRYLTPNDIRKALGSEPTDANKGHDDGESGFLI